MDGYSHSEQDVARPAEGRGSGADRLNDLGGLGSDEEIGVPERLALEVVQGQRANATLPSRCHGVTGRMSVNALPLLSPSLTAVTLPPWSSASLLTNDNPSPKPLSLRSLDRSTCV